MCVFFVCVLAPPLLPLLLFARLLMFFCPLLLLLCVCVFFHLSFIIRRTTFANLPLFRACVFVYDLFFFSSFDGYRSFHLALSRPHSIAHICSLHILIHNAGFLISSSSLIWSFRMFAVLLKLVHVDKRTHTQFVFRHIFFRILFFNSLFVRTYVRV